MKETSGATILHGSINASNQAMGSILVKIRRRQNGNTKHRYTRIDERLVHGQGQLWVKSLGVNTVIVANDQASQMQWHKL